MSALQTRDLYTFFNRIFTSRPGRFPESSSSVNAWYTIKNFYFFGKIQKYYCIPNIWCGLGLIREAAGKFGNYNKFIIFIKIQLKQTKLK
jgi:hypothetical protein